MSGLTVLRIGNAAMIVGALLAAGLGQAIVGAVFASTGIIVGAIAIAIEELKP